MFFEFQFKNRYNLLIKGAFFSPPLPPAAPSKGTLIIQHGLSGYRDQAYIQVIIKYACSLGFHAISFDATHSFGKSEGDLSNACLTKHAQDLEDVIEFIYSTSTDFNFPNNFNPKHLVLCGHSLGAASVMLYATRYPQFVRCVIALSMVTNLQNWQQAFLDYRPTEWAQWLKNGYFEKTDSLTGKIGRVSLDFLKDLSNYNLIDNVALLKCPLFLGTGEKDETTLLETQKQIWAALPEYLHQKSIFKTYPHAPHTFQMPHHIDILSKDINDFLSLL
jgi:pimeloyl-ACP methyl ester carboxylesterase